MTAEPVVAALMARLVEVRRILSDAATNPSRRQRIRQAIRLIDSELSVTSTTNCATISGAPPADNR